MQVIPHADLVVRYLAVDGSGTLFAPYYHMFYRGQLVYGGPEEPDEPDLVLTGRADLLLSLFVGTATLLETAGPEQVRDNLLAVSLLTGLVESSDYIEAVSACADSVESLLDHATREFGVAAG
jgi:hypothetical protein